MQFPIGTQVVHQTYGVGIVKSYSKQVIVGNKEREYYEVVIGNATVWVPINEQGDVALRRVAPKHTLDECRKVLKSRPLPLDKNYHMRQLEIANRMKSKLLPELCEMVRDLRARHQQTPLGVTENNLLRKISKAIGDEWAAIDGITIESALAEIESLLQESTGTKILAKEI
jgi:RNA polymerase-interacting CarD/CdnL/TRCF family regulator